MSDTPQNPSGIPATPSPPSRSGDGHPPHNGPNGPGRREGIVGKVEERVEETVRHRGTAQQGTTQQGTGRREGGIEGMKERVEGAAGRVEDTVRHREGGGARPPGEGHAVPTGGGPKKSFPTGPLAIALGALALLTLLAGILLWRAHDREDTPQHAARGLYERLADNDCEGAAHYLSRELLEADYNGSERAAVEDCERDMSQGNPLEDARVRNSRVISREGDTATVEVTATIDGQEEAQPVNMVREDGEWRVAPGGAGDEVQP